MFAAFFAQAARSPGRQRVFRRTVVAHLALLLALLALLPLSPSGGTPTVLFGQLLLIAGIVEGATLIGWRLTQLPKSQALEFLLVSPLRPFRVLLNEACVGLGLLALVTMSGLPLLCLLAASGVLSDADLFVMTILPCTWGAITGLLLTAWAYEPLRVRCWGERVVMILVLIYLVAGVLAGEKLSQWLHELPEEIGYPIYRGLIAFRDYNPFGAMRYWTEHRDEAGEELMIVVEAGSLLLLLGLLIRSACRLEPHFHERHYRPAVLSDNGNRGQIADRPLTWWAVKRVSEYSGRINLWLAGGFSVLYALYHIAGSQWPAWMGRSVFEIADRYLGLGGLATALVVLAAVPAAFQYGLWDASVPDRCRRLELLLLTRLQARDYWHAAATAAWKRGRGYFAVAVLLWIAALCSGEAGCDRVLAAMAAGVLLWALYFALGFRSFSRGAHANGLGMLLTVGLPMAAIALYKLGWPVLSSLLPPGSVYGSMTLTGAAWALGPVLAAILALVMVRQGLDDCDAHLRRWYDQHQGRKVMT
jgi:hypothetical protein